MSFTSQEIASRSAEARIAKDKESLADAVCEALIKTIQEAVDERQSCSLVLSGGSTPKALYQRMAARHSEIPWDKLHLYWGDERFVPHDDPGSNFRMVKEAMLDHVPIPADNIHPMPTDAGSPEAAASTHEDELGQLFGGEMPRFDIVLLGLGTDGHTASLFPGTDAIEEDGWVAAGEAPVTPHQRLTLTFPLIQHARQIHFLIAGVGKAAPFAAMHQEPISPSERPAGAIQPTNGQLIYWLDQDAAGS